MIFNKKKNPKPFYIFLIYILLAKNKSQKYDKLCYN